MSAYTLLAKCVTISFHIDFLDINYTLQPSHKRGQFTKKPYSNSVAQLHSLLSCLYYQLQIDFMERKLDLCCCHQSNTLPKKYSYFPLFVEIKLTQLIITWITVYLESRQQNCISGFVTPYLASSKSNPVSNPIMRGCVQ